MDLRKVYWHHLEIEEIDTLGFSMYHDEKPYIVIYCIAAI